jgi:hypothetical protein
MFVDILANFDEGIVLEDILVGNMPVLQHCVKHGCLGELELLLPLCKNIMANKHNKSSPLHVNGYLPRYYDECVKMFINRGVDVEMKDGNGKTFMDTLLEAETHRMGRFELFGANYEYRVVCYSRFGYSFTTGYGNDKIEYKASEFTNLLVYGNGSTKKSAI